MTQQEMVDREIRMVLGDLQLQLVFAKARVAELESQLGALQAEIKPKANGLDKSRPDSSFLEKQ